MRFRRSDLYALPILKTDAFYWWRVRTAGPNDYSNGADRRRKVIFLLTAINVPKLNGHKTKRFGYGR